MLPTSGTAGVSMVSAVTAAPPLAPATRGSIASTSTIHGGDGLSKARRPTISTPGSFLATLNETRAALGGMAVDFGASSEAVMTSPPCGTCGCGTFVAHKFLPSLKCQSCFHDHTAT